MRKWMLLGAVVVVASFMAAPASAQEVVKTQPKVITSSTTTEMVPVQQRVGLLGRLRGQQRTVMMAQPITTPKTETIPITPNTVKQAGGTEPMPTAQMPQTIERRQGILARLRIRR